MHKIKRWMQEDGWFAENENQEIQKFIQDFRFEDPVFLNSPTNAVQFDFTSLPMRRRKKRIRQIVSAILKDRELFVCEYGSIGLQEKRKLTKGHPKKENCFEFQSFCEDISYLYDNVTYIRLLPNQLRIAKFVGKAFQKRADEQYYIISLQDPLGLRLYDERGMVVISPNKEMVRQLQTEFSELVMRCSWDEE